MATVFVVAALGHAWGLSRGTAGFAALLVLCDPILIQQSAMVTPDTLATFLAACSLLCLAKVEPSSPSYGTTILGGFALGLSVLTSASFLPWAALVFVVGAAIEFRRSGNGLRSAVLLAAFCVTMSPWVVRNWLIFGQPLVTNTHGGYVFHRANNDDYYQHLREMPSGSIWDHTDFDRDCRALRMAQRTMSDEASELQFDATTYERGWATICEQPATFAYAALVRIARLYAVAPWQSDLPALSHRSGVRRAVAVFYALEFALAAVGVWLLGRRLLEPPWIFATLLVVTLTLVHAFYLTEMRMRAPLMPIIAMTAAEGASWIAQAIAHRLCSYVAARSALREEDNFISST
jgi:4-amino-4-deoxy-L-arabinose transferase-like glycosyltransferase